MTATPLVEKATPLLPSVGTKDVLRLAWPTMLSFILNNTYRINDQYWVQGLGSSAQAALGSSFFVLVMNFSIYFLVIGGVLPLVARATGAGNVKERDRWIRHGLAAAFGISSLVSLLGLFFVGDLTELLGLEDSVRESATAYLGTLYWFTLPMALAPTLETIFISMGHTRIPLVMQATAVTCNFLLNPVLIFGRQRFEWLPFDGLGIEGAAIATILSRTVSASLGLAILYKRFGVHFFRGLQLRTSRIIEILKIGAPNALAIAAYAGVYWVLLSVVVSDLGEKVIAALGLGLTVFEGVSFPLFLGIALAGSSLVGRSLGAGSSENAKNAVSRLRLIATVTGIGIGAVFLIAGPLCVPLFTDDPDVLRETLKYVSILAFSQVFVAHEAVHEKILLGAGHSRPIFLISVPGNALRIPLAWYLSTHLELGAVGVWWAINVTTLIKASAYFFVVRSLDWGHIQRQRA